MCGIAGVLSAGAPLDDADGALVERMVHTLRHRGPDGLRVQRLPNAILGNSRLAIIDLTDRAALPMSNEDGSIWLAYNGEITNFRQLESRFHLRERHTFRSQSDSEVLVHLYEELGIEFLRELSGYFSFCLVDNRAGVAHVVRDFFGVRPLFYAKHRGRLIFASEIKALLEIPTLDRRLDVEGFFHYFTLAYIPVPRTPFAAIAELDGGHRLEVDLRTGEIAEHEYYAPSFGTAADRPEEEVARELRTILTDSVERNLVADVPVGLALSGGVDSTSLLLLATELGRPLHTFSIEMAEPSFNERRFQEVVVRRANSVHHRVPVGPAAIREHLRRHLAFQDEPSGDGANIPMFILAQQARKHVKVLLSGEGGDEVFYAYETQRACAMRRRYRQWVPGPVRGGVRRALRMLPVSHRKLSFDFVSKRFTEGCELGVPEAHAYWRHCLVDADIRDLVVGSGPFASTAEMFRDIYDRSECSDDHDRLALLDLKQYFIGDLMVKNDRMAMAHSIETRYPYVDRMVAEFGLSLPSRLKLRGTRERRIQKLAMKDLLPPEVFGRRNMGLELPHSAWFLGELRPLVEQYFVRERIGRTGLLDPDKVAALWDEHSRRQKDHGRALWSVMNLIVWFELFVASSDYKEYVGGA